MRREPFFPSSSIKENQENKVVWRSLSGLRRMPGQTWLMWLHQKTWILTGTTGFVWINPLLAFPNKLWGRPIVLFNDKIKFAIILWIVAKPLDVENQQVHNIIVLIKFFSSKSGSPALPFSTLTTSSWPQMMAILWWGNRPCLELLLKRTMTSFDFWIIYLKTSNYR